MNDRHRSVLFARLLLAMVLVVGLLHGSARPAAAATQIDIHGPAGSVRFGTRIAALPNGNFVVTDPEYDGGIGAEAGAVHLYNGATGARISTLTGSSAGHRVGSGGVTVLSNGNYVVASPEWDAGLETDAGAVTWGSQVSGVSGAITALNSLVGGHAGDGVGSGGVIALTNGNYVVVSPMWDRGGLADAGAITGGSGTAGVKGVVSALNSLVGGHAEDQVGSGGVYVLSTGNYVVVSPNWDSIEFEDAGAVTGGSGVTGLKGLVSYTNSLVGDHDGDQVGSGGLTVLSDGDYVVSSPFWDNDATADAGAVTWGSGVTGVKGLVSADNSLVGGAAGDQVGSEGVTALSNGNYVVASPYWNTTGVPDAGAATWGNGDGGTVGPVSTTNSLVGEHANDQVGYGSVTALNNGNYVVASYFWKNGSISTAGAVTWVDGTTWTSGEVSAANSLVGRQDDDRVGGGGVTPLSNGNYVVNSPYWDNDVVTNAGAVTWGDGDGGTSGPVSTDNSLVGSTANDQVGHEFHMAIPLSNGNYVAPSPHWDNEGVVDAGAATWGNGDGGTTGPISELNSLVGSAPYDRVGDEGVTALDNGNYVVLSEDWDNGGTAEAGAATWGSGAGGITGPVSELNSLVGSSVEDHVGGGSVGGLKNGNYVVGSPSWSNGGVLDVGAVTWGNGTSGIKGVISAANSLVGSTTGDRIGGLGSGRWLSNGDYVMISQFWDNGTTADAGAVSWGFGPHGAAGPLSALNSVRGTTAGGGSDMEFSHDAVNHQLVVGRPADNLVTLFRLVHGVSVTPPTGAKSGAPGAAVSYTLQVSNTGDLEDSFNLAAGGNAWTTSITPAAVGPLAPGESGSVTVSVTVPASAAGGATDSATVTVTSQADAAKTDTTKLTTTAGNVYAVAIAPPTNAESGAPGTSVSYTLQVTNAGNTAQSFNLAASGNKWTTSLPATVGPIAAGGSQNVTITVSVPGSAASGSADTALITAACQADGTKKDTAALTTTAGVRKIYMPVVRKK